MKKALNRNIDGQMDIADFMGPLNSQEQILCYLNYFKNMVIDAGDHEAGDNLELVGAMIEQGQDFQALPRLIALCQNTSHFRPVYHVIAFVKDRIEMHKLRITVN